jgi:hypothetical protein
LEQVAVHIPTRTREVGAVETDDYAMTFTSDTIPTSGHVHTLIDQACAWVLSQVGSPVVSPAQDACQVAAALWTAYWIERGFPERDADVKVYDRIRDDAISAAKHAAAVNKAAGGGTSLNPDAVETVLPAHTFPDPPKWADVTFW